MRLRAPFLLLAVITWLYVLQGIRYATAAPGDEEVWSKGGPAVQSPDAVGLQGRYAVALYGAATKAKTLEAVAKDLKAVRRKLAMSAWCRIVFLLCVLFA